jgi:radical SAM protein with 4Fe4S-binding SPASM domain
MVNLCVVRVNGGLISQLRMPIPPSKTPPREVRADDDGPKPLLAVWEVTLRCDQTCAHCGSRAGKARVDELSTEEMLDVARALVRLGCREVALIGGEAYLRNDLEELVRLLADNGVHAMMQTGGRTLTRERLVSLKDAGLGGVGVSVDGPAEVHDILRGNPGSHAAAVRALEAARELGFVLTANTQINRLNWRLLEPLSRDLRSRGVLAWQVQLTVPMGRAADRPEWIIEPWRVVEIIDTLAAIQLDAAENYRGGTPFNVFAGSSIGYFGPHEQVLRSRPGGPDIHWRGCMAGRYSIGIEADGTVKGCPSLPTRDYAGGNVRDLSLESIWETSEKVRFVRDRTLDELWGFCRTCYYAEVCRAGCSWTAHVTLGRRGNFPFCYYRVTQLKSRGVRERLVHREHPEGIPFDYGRFEIVEEPWCEDEPDAAMPRRLPLVQ